MQFEDHRTAQRGDVLAGSGEVGDQDGVVGSVNQASGVEILDDA